MQHIFIVNAAITLLMGVALWLIWLEDTAQRFIHRIAIMQFLTCMTTLAFLLYNGTNPSLKMLGTVLLPACGGLQFIVALWAIADLADRTFSQVQWTTALVLILLVYGGVFALRNAEAWIVCNSTYYLLLGGYAIYLLRGSRPTERSVGWIFIALGINSLMPLAGDMVAGVQLQVSIGTVLRVLLGLAFIFTALARTRESANQERGRFLQLTEHSLHALLVCDTRRVRYANAAAARLLGHDQTATFIEAGYPSVQALLDQGTTFRDIEATMRDGLSLRGFEATRMQPDGRQTHLHLDGWGTEWDGQPAIALVLTDRTEQQQAQETMQQLAQENERQRIEFAERIKNNLLASNAELEQRVQDRTAELEQASAAKSQFLANMSHEIRTPMNAVLGMLRLLHGTKLDPRQLDYLAKTQGAAQSLLGLLNDILDFSKIDAGKMQLEERPFELDRMLRDLGVILAMHAEHKDLDVLYAIDPAVPSHLCGDSLRLHQVLLNLCTNAIKFTPAGDVVLSISICPGAAGTTRLRFAVTDTGIGISQEDQGHIFEAFSQADGSITRKFGGTGLGLSISRRLVQLMGGEIYLRSAPSQGSTFWFELDFGDASIPAESQDNDAAMRQPFHVLLVDGNVRARETLGMLARGLGWSVDTAGDSEEALRCVEARKFRNAPPLDCIFADWDVPGSGGWETLDTAGRACGLDAPLALIMLSSNGRDVLDQLSREQQARLDGFVVKPITARMLGDALLAARAGRTALRQKPRPTTHARLRLQGMRLLLVEDNPLNQLVAQELLQAEGAVVVLAGDGQQALDMLRQSAASFDAVLMDMQMPVMDGLTASQAIRGTLQLTEMPIIAMTANTTQADRDACAHAGMNAHVGKPIDIGYLVQVLLQQTGATESEHSARREGPTTLATACNHDDALLPESTQMIASDFDQAAAIDRLGGDESLYRQILDVYLRDLHTVPALLDARLGQKDWRGAALMLHTQKGTAATVGAMRLSAIAADAEARLKSASDNFDPQMLRDSLLAAIDQAESYLRNSTTMAEH